MVLATHDYIQTFTAIAEDIPAFRSVQDYNYWRAMYMPDTLVGFKEGLHVLRHSSVKVLKTFLMYAVDWPRDPHIHTWLPWVDYLREFVRGIDLNGYLHYEVGISIRG